MLKNLRNGACGPRKASVEALLAYLPPAARAAALAAPAAAGPAAPAAGLAAGRAGLLAHAAAPAAAGRRGRGIIAAVAIRAWVGDAMAMATATAAGLAVAALAATAAAALPAAAPRPARGAAASSPRATAGPAIGPGVIAGGGGGGSGGGGSCWLLDPGCRVGHMMSCLDEWVWGADCLCAPGRAGGGYPAAGEEGRRFSVLWGGIM